MATANTLSMDLLQGGSPSKRTLRDRAADMTLSQLRKWLLNCYLLWVAGALALYYVPYFDTHSIPLIGVHFAQLQPAGSTLAKLIVVPLAVLYMLVTWVLMPYILPQRWHRLVRLVAIAPAPVMLWMVLFRRGIWPWQLPPFGGQNPILDQDMQMESDLDYEHERSSDPFE